MERRGHDAALVTVTPVDTVQYCSPRLPSSEPSFKACVCADMEKKDEGTMNPERDQLEPLSASAGFETSGQQCHSNWEIGRTTATGCLTVGVGSNVEGDTSSPTECVGTRADNEITTAPAASNTVFLQPGRKPNDKKTLSAPASVLMPIRNGFSLPFCSLALCRKGHVSSTTNWTLLS